MAPLHDDVAWMDRDYFEPFDVEEEDENALSFWEDEDLYSNLGDDDNE